MGLKFVSSVETFSTFVAFVGLLTSMDASVSFNVVFSGVFLSTLCAFVQFYSGVRKKFASV